MSVLLTHHPARRPGREGDRMRARLVPTEGGPPIELVKDLTLVGRGEDCDVRLDHRSVSKLHCIVVKADGLILVRDLGSTNGTRVNGQKVRRAALLPNDSLHIASVKYEVKVGADPEAAEARPATRRNAHPDIYPEPNAPHGS